MNGHCAHCPPDCDDPVMVFTSVLGLAADAVDGHCPLCAQTAELGVQR